MVKAMSDCDVEEKFRKSGRCVGDTCCDSLVIGMFSGLFHDIF